MRWLTNGQEDSGNLRIENIVVKITVIIIIIVVIMVGDMMMSVMYRDRGINMGKIIEIRAELSLDIKMIIQEHTTTTITIITIVNRINRK